MSEARYWAIGIAMLEMALVALFSFALGTYLTRRLWSLRDASHRIGDEGPGFHIPIQGNDEVAQAIVAFNGMSQRLAASYAKQQQALEQSRELGLRIEAGIAQKAAMVEAALDAIITIDLDGFILEYNRSAEETFGFSLDEAIGRRLEELIIPDEHKHAHNQGMQHFRATGVGPVLGKRMELPALHKSGMRFPVEIAITHVATESGEYFTAFMRDISERKRAEDELRLAAQAFEAQEAIFITDANSPYIAGQPRLLPPSPATTPEDVIGKTPRVFKSYRQDSEFYRGMWDQRPAPTGIGRARSRTGARTARCFRSASASPRYATPRAERPTMSPTSSTSPSKNAMRRTLDRVPGQGRAGESGQVALPRDHEP
jgi:two-component system sensor histidine kinase/response regulator